MCPPSAWCSHRLTAAGASWPCGARKDPSDLVSGRPLPSVPILCLVRGEAGLAFSVSSALTRVGEDREPPSSQ